MNENKENEESLGQGEPGCCKTKREDCPHCGRCPKCGRKTGDYTPWYPYPYYPYYPYDPNVVWIYNNGNYEIRVS